MLARSLSRARLATKLCARSASTSSPFAPDASGTVLPDGSLWGDFAASEVQVSDRAGVFAGAQVELVASGFRWTEGPTWVADSRSLYFSDTIDARIYRWRESDGVQIVASGSGGYRPAQPDDAGTQPGAGNLPNYLPSEIDHFDSLFEPGSNGTTLHEGQLYVCQHPLRRVVRTTPAALDALGGGPMWESGFEVVADRSPEGRRLNAPNDVIVSPGGDVLFTDPVYGFLRKQPADLGHGYLNAEQGLHPDQAYLDEECQRSGAGYKGVYRLRAGAASHEIELLTAALERPNGLALSRDGATLWVANSDRKTPSWSAFGMGGELPLPQLRTLCEQSLGASLQLGPGLSDGFKLDEHDRIWASVPGGLAVLDPAAAAGGAVLATVRFGTNTSNVCFGTDGDVWISGLGHLWRMRRNLA